MSGQKLTPEFRKRADEVIDRLNEQTRQAPTGQVSASAMYATARFNAFQVAATAEDAQQLKADRDKAIEYFTDQYRKMFTDHLDDCLQNFEQYLGRGDDQA